MTRAKFERAHPGAFFLEPGEPAALAAHLRRLGVLATPGRTLIVKQARPWVEKYPQFAAPWDRARREAEFYALVAGVPAVAAFMPRLLAADADARLLVLEDLGPGADLTGLYRGGVLAAADVDALADFLSALHGAFAGPPRPGLLANREMRALNAEHIFLLPLRDEGGPDLDALQPGLAAAAAPLKADAALRAAAERLGRAAYLADGPCLLHGDFFPGSLLRTPAGPRVIDPEFGFFGRAEFDVGVLAAHLALARQPDALAARLRARYRPPAGWDAALTRQFAGVEIIRRLLGYAQLPLALDVPAKAALLARARRLVLEPAAAEADPGF
jgi:5-methylthioribose kinase